MNIYITFPGVRRSEHKADHSNQCNATVKNTWNSRRNTTLHNPVMANRELGLDSTHFNLAVGWKGRASCSDRFVPRKGRRLAVPNGGLSVASNRNVHAFVRIDLCHTAPSRSHRLLNFWNNSPVETLKYLMKKNCSIFYPHKDKKFYVIIHDSG